MNAHTDRLIKDVLCLPSDERAAVAAAIVDSLASDEVAVIPEAWRTELLRRRDDLRSGRVLAQPWAEAKARLAAL